MKESVSLLRQKLLREKVRPSEEIDEKKNKELHNLLEKVKLKVDYHPI